MASTYPNPPFATPKPKEVAFSLFDRQFECMDLLTDLEHTQILYGGGARGGKSYLGCSWVISQALAKPGSRWLVGRMDLVALKQTTLQTFKTVWRKMGFEWDDAGYNDNLGMFTLPNGSIVYFKHLKFLPTDPEFDRLGSLDLTGFFIDEAQEVRWKAVSVLMGRLSLTRRDEDGVKWETVPKAFFTCNPHKGWVRSQFVKPHREGSLPPYRAFVKALVTDNPEVPPEYVENLMRSGDRVTVERLVYGNFDWAEDDGSIFQPDVLDDMFRTSAVPGSKYLSVDVARLGKDRSVVWLWDGLRARLVLNKQGLDTKELAEAVRDLEIKHSVPRQNVVVDADGVGGGVVDQLRGCVPFVNNGSPVQPMEAKNNPSYKVQWSNLKTQCFMKLSELMKFGRISVDVGEEQDVRIQLCEELSAHRLENPDSDGKKKLVPKDEMKEDLEGRSPDLADALAMRMWFEVQPFTPKDRPAGTVEAQNRSAPRVAKRFFDPRSARWVTK